MFKAVNEFSIIDAVSLLNMYARKLTVARTATASCCP